jgi:hypothetical protein
VEVSLPATKCDVKALCGQKALQALQIQSWIEGMMFQVVDYSKTNTDS